MDQSRGNLEDPVAYNGKIEIRLFPFLRFIFEGILTFIIITFFLEILYRSRDLFVQRGFLLVTPIVQFRSVVGVEHASSIFIDSRRK